ncbi:MAG: hypothetical protein ACE5PV_07030 [Candidatus Poribacteria bacterium]
MPHTVRVTTKPSGADRSWIEAGSFEVDDFGEKKWIRRSHPTQDRRLKVERADSGYASQMIDWMIVIPDNYPLTIAKITYDRRHPKQIDVLWSPSSSEQNLDREEKIKRAFELAQGNAELTELLKELLL